MNSRKVVVLLVLTGAVALCLIGFGNLLSDWRVANVSTEFRGAERVVVNALPSEEERVRGVLPSRLALELPADVPRVPAIDGFDLNVGQTLIVRDHRLASFGDFARSSLSLVFRAAGVVLLAAGGILLFRQQFEIVRKDPPLKKV